MALENLKFENAEIRFRNFAGAERDFNPLGNRNFCVFMDVEKGRELKELGWNVKFTKPSDKSGQEPKAYIQVSVKFEYVPPRVYLLNGVTAEELTETTISILDWSDIKTADVEIRPYVWSMNGKTGVKAYLKTMYVVIQEDPFMKKYADQLREKDKLAESGKLYDQPDDDDVPF